MITRRTGARFVPLMLAVAGAASGSVSCANDTVGQNTGSPGEDAAAADEASSTSSSSGAGSGSGASSGAGSGSGSGGSGASSSGSGGSAFEAGIPTSAMCDMNGRWLVAQRVLAQALGQTQASHNWFYYEIQQNGDQVLVTKGLNCGYEVKAVTPLGANVDSHLAWPALLVHNSDAGRKGTMTVSGSGCQLAIEKRYTVRGATISYYSDPSTTMPGPTQQAMGTTPGWEDWDMDGNPGISLVVSGAATGTLYCAQRDWNQWTGSVAANSTKFSIPVTWDSGQDPLGYSGSQLVTQAATPSTDATQHYVWFAKLDATQATGDDTAICAAIRSLVPTLTPAALQ